MNIEADPQFEFFATDEAIKEIEARLDGELDTERLAALIELAWQMRQRDTYRALSLVKEAETLMPTTTLSKEAQSACACRLMLVRGEAKWLMGEIEPSTILTDHALQGFLLLNDTLGCADAHWLHAWIAFECGNFDRFKQEFQKMLSVSEQVDQVRAMVARATLAIISAVIGNGDEVRIWQEYFVGAATELHPAVECVIEDFFGYVTERKGEHAECIAHRNRVYTLALQCGQFRRAIIAASNIGDEFDQLNDNEAALEWRQRALDLSRTSGWSVLLGVAQVRTAETLRRLGRFEVAEILMRESIELLASVETSSNFAEWLNVRGNIELDLQQYTLAFETFTQLEKRSTGLASRMLSVAFCGQAKALLHLNRPILALEKAQHALVAAETNAGHQIEVLMVLATISADQSIPSLDELNAPSAPLHYLQQALAIAATIENYTVSAQLLEAVALEHARIENYKVAYNFLQEEVATIVKQNIIASSNKAITMQMRFETERARTEANYHRQLTIVNAERLKTLEELSEIGREITGKLESGAVIATLSRYVNRMVDASNFLMYQLNIDGLSLQITFAVNTDQSTSTHEIQVSDETNCAAQCARERREIVIQKMNGERGRPATAGEMQSLIYEPLIAGDRLHGIMAICSDRPNAFGDREIAVVKTLGAYGAIALANAEIQSQLTEQNKQLEILSTSDRLTGLRNRRHLDNVLNEEIERSERSAVIFSIILLDIDHFKSVNDIHGHQVGDQVLVAFATILKDGVRKPDVVGRWGGEEFLIVCPETDLQGAVILANRLRSLIAHHSFPTVGQKTGSFGVASLKMSESAGNLISRADAALYRAKHSGRDRVESES